MQKTTKKTRDRPSECLGKGENIVETHGNIGGGKGYGRKGKNEWKRMRLKSAVRDNATEKQRAKSCLAVRVS